MFEVERDLRLVFNTCALKMTYVEKKVHMTPAFSDLYHSVLEYLNTDCIVGTESQTLQNICLICVPAKSYFSQSHAHMVAMTVPFINGILQLKVSVTNEFPDSSIFSFPSFLKMSDEEYSVYSVSAC